MAVINGVRQAYRGVLNRIGDMSDDELDELRRDLEGNDPDGEYSIDVQEAVEAEITARYATAHLDCCTFVVG